MITGDDIPTEVPFLEGAAVFQFACYGYGTPRESDYSHWLGEPELNTADDFIAALPKRLLAHPRGPVVYVGHLDLAWLHGFADPKAPDITDFYHNRLEPFARAVDSFLQAIPAGEAMGPMNRRYAFGNAQLTTTWDRIQRGTLKVTAESFPRLADEFISRSDAQNFMVLGDPAAAVRVPAA